MRGLRTHESEQFELFFEGVQKQAKKQDAVFFLNYGECVGEIFGRMEIDNLFGWLIPMNKADAFEAEFIENAEGEKWDDFLIWCIAKISNDLRIEFKEF